MGRGVVGLAARTGPDERLPGSDEICSALMGLTPDVVFAIDGDMRTVLVNPAAVRFLGCPVEEILGARVADLFGPRGAQFEQHLADAVAAGRLLEFENAMHIGESEVWLKTSLVPLTDMAPGLVLGVSRDITASKRLEAELRAHTEEVEHLATHDSLTGIGNRRAFIAALDRALALCRRGTCSMVLFMDIDEFKRCNDERGHVFGDQVLVSAATRLQNEVREVDLVARVGGDEFAAALVGSSEDGASEVARRMRASIQALGDEIGIPIGLSTGAVPVDPGGSIDGIMSAADHMMYQHKEERRRTRTSMKRA